MGRWPEGPEGPRRSPPHSWGGGPQGRRGLSGSRRPLPSLRRRRPQALQVVVRPLAWKEYVREHGIEVEQDPSRVVVTVDGEGPAVARFRRLHHRVGDGAHLAVSLALADDEVVGD